MRNGEVEESKMTDRNDILLKEYETCQSHNNSIASQYWVILGIFVSINTAILAGVIYGIISEGMPLGANISRLVLVLGFGIIAIIVLLWLYFGRVNFVISVNYHRMREIEIKLGMWKNWEIHTLDKWWDVRNKIGFKGSGELSDDDHNKIWDKLQEELKNGLSAEDLKKLSEEKERLVKLYNSYSSRRRFWVGSFNYVSPIGRQSFAWIFIVLIILWIFLIVMTFILN